MNRYCVFLSIHPNVAIETFRKHYDPLAAKVQPHLTLVHPFVSTEENRVITHISKLFEIKNRRFAFQNPEWKHGYVTLPVKHEELLTVRKRLYSDVLKPHLREEYPYSPHITLGQYGSDEEMAKQKRFAQTLEFTNAGHFQAVVLEKILEDESSEIVYSHSIVAGGFDETS